MSVSGIDACLPAGQRIARHDQLVDGLKVAMMWNEGVMWCWLRCRLQFFIDWFTLRLATKHYEFTKTKQKQKWEKCNCELWIPRREAWGRSSSKCMIIDKKKTPVDEQYGQKFRIVSAPFTTSFVWLLKSHFQCFFSSSLGLRLFFIAFSFT